MNISNSKKCEIFEICFEYHYKIAYPVLQTNNQIKSCMRTDCRCCTLCIAYHAYVTVRIVMEMVVKMSDSITILAQVSGIISAYNAEYLQCSTSNQYQVLDTGHSEHFPKFGSNSLMLITPSFAKLS